VQADQMTAGGQNCRDCGHPARHRELEKKAQQRAKVRRRFFKAVRNRRAKLVELEGLCDELVNLHGGVREVATGYHDDYHSQPGGTTRQSRENSAH